ncbi:reverse transcriptase domain-containing protein [Tanacetum coccineum]|uniref:Reverse transcriptase domain-containing protein n=1 Tax=Tanacetum coccineum TaxID=301880 RepID=A0ABQ5IXC2_9ASTR
MSNELKNVMTNFLQMQNPLGSGSLPSNTVANPRVDVKAITTRSGVAYDGPTIPPTPSPLPKEVERENEATKNKVQTTSSESTAHVQPPVVQVHILELEVTPKLHFDISFADALLHMHKFASTFKSLLNNKEKLFELANTPLNENCSAVLLKQLPKKLGDPGKFLIPSLTRMTLELADRLVAHRKGVVEDVFIKVGKFYFPADFVVVYYDVDPRVPLILRRPFLRTARALIDVHGEELTLRVNDKAITFKVGHTSRYSHNYYDETVHQVNVIDVACKEYAQEVLGFSDVRQVAIRLLRILSSFFFLMFTLLKGGDFILEK